MLVAVAVDGVGGCEDAGPEAAEAAGAAAEGRRTVAAPGPDLTSTRMSPKGDRYAKLNGSGEASWLAASPDAISRSNPWIWLSLSGSRVIGRTEPFCRSEAGLPTAS